SLADRAAGLAGGSCDSRSVLYVGGGVPVRAGGGGADRGGGINPGGRAGLWHRTAPAEGPKKTGTGLMAGHRPRARRPPRGLVVPPALAPARPRGAGRRLADRVVHPAGAVLSFQAVQLLLWLDALPFRAVFLGNPDRSGSHHHGERRDGGVGVRSFRFDESRSDRGTRVDLVTGDAGNRSGRAGVDGGARPCTVSGRP